MAVALMRCAKVLLSAETVPVGAGCCGTLQGLSDSGSVATSAAAGAEPEGPATSAMLLGGCFGSAGAFAGGAFTGNGFPTGMPGGDGGAFTGTGDEG